MFDNLKSKKSPSECVNNDENPPVIEYDDSKSKKSKIRRANTKNIDTKQKKPKNKKLNLLKGNSFVVKNLEESESESVSKKSDEIGLIKRKVTYEDDFLNLYPYAA